MTNLKGKAGELLENFERMACGGLFETLPIEAWDDGYGVAVQNLKTKSALVYGDVRDPDKDHEAAVPVSVSADEFLDYLKVFEKTDEVTITFEEGKVELNGPNDNAIIYPDAKPPVLNDVLLKKCVAALAGELEWRRVGQESPDSAKPTIITIEAAQLQRVLSRAKTNQSKDVFLEFAEPGLAKATLLKEGAKQNKIASTLTGAHVKGPSVNVVLDEDEYRKVATTLKGTIQLQATPGFPLVVVSKSDKATFVYLLAQRK